MLRQMVWEPVLWQFRHESVGGDFAPYNLRGNADQHKSRTPQRSGSVRHTYEPQ